MTRISGQAFALALFLFFTSSVAHAIPSGELPSEELAGTPIDGGTVTFIIPTEPPHLLALIESDGWMKEITIPHLYEPLVVHDPHDDPDYRVAPRLAESWAVSPDHLTYTFKIRQGVRWHDGQPFSVDDVVFTFDKLMDPGVRAISLRNYFQDLAKWEKVDATTFRLVYKKPYFLTLDTLVDVPIIPKHIFGAGDLNTHSSLRAPVGTGPFKFVSWEPGSKKIVYARNELYWGKKAHLDGLVFRIIEDRTVAAQVMERGDADLYTFYTPDRWIKLDADLRFTKDYWPFKFFTANYVWIGWNEKRPFFADARVRTAMTLLSNRPYFQDRIFKHLYVDHTCHFYWKSKDCDPTLAPLPYDVARAQKLLAQAGWADHDGDGVLDKDGVPFRFTFLFGNGSVLGEQIGTVLRDSLRKVGIVMDLQKLEWSTFTNRLRNHAFDASTLVWSGAARGDPYQVWHSSQAADGSNYISFNNKIADQLIEQGRAEFDAEKRHGIYRAFGKVLYDEQPYTWLGTRAELGALRKRVRGATFNLKHWNFADWWIASP